MTTADAKRWAAANGIAVVPSKVNPGRFCVTTNPGYLGMILSEETEQEVWDTIAERLAPIVESVQRMNAAAVVEGPWRVKKYVREKMWGVWHEDGNTIMAFANEQSARIIANEFNRDLAADHIGEANKKVGGSGATD